MTEAMILLVDDEPSNIDVLRAVLKADYRLKVALNGEKALKIAASAPAPDLVLLDVMMPDMDGYQVCRQLKAEPATASIPVLFVTGHTDASDAEKCRASGGEGMISKPIDADELKAQVKALLGH